MRLLKESVMQIWKRGRQPSATSSRKLNEQRRQFRTSSTVSNEKGSRLSEAKEVDQNRASWNQVIIWLCNIEVLRTAA
jgi:hypothetical protein